VYRGLDKRVASRLGKTSRWRTATAVYGYEDGAADSFGAPRHLAYNVFMTYQLATGGQLADC
jgi:hypothetical protein